MAKGDSDQGWWSYFSHLIDIIFSSLEDSTSRYPVEDVGSALEDHSDSYSRDPVPLCQKCEEDVRAGCSGLSEIQCENVTFFLGGGCE